MASWKAVPWYLRTAIEGSIVVLAVLLLVTAGPYLRNLYERRIEKSLDEFTDGLNEAKNPDELPLVHGKPAQDDLTEDFNAEGDTDDQDDTPSLSDLDVKVGISEIWRFNLRTSSPREIRPKIVDALINLSVPKNTAGLGGVEAPGGIQFDLFVPQKIVPNLKHQLENLVPSVSPRDNDSHPSVHEVFTWYKNKSKRKIPDGKTRVVIWLSQM